MTQDRGKLVAAAIGAAVFVAYATAGHLASREPGAAHWAVPFAVTPPLLLAAGLVRGVLGGLVGSLAAGALLLLAATSVYAAWPWLQANLYHVYFMDHVGSLAALGLFFGHTLVGGREPLVTQFARQLQDPLTPLLERYTRRVTLAWTLFFGAMVALSFALYAWAAISTWSLFANILTLPLVGCLFLGEVLLRRWVLPPQDRVGLVASLRAYQQTMARRSRRPGDAPAP